ncbi:hypothetical protein GCM10012284_28260 [Mangrovihabitans endophyticus]|uniref:Uncharacterized protein n=1 Tax=Mangrovihabitans endophyticus TaxID=1751298 RepID=A0A8J3C184_9ACTN|nr:hypothetical protein GCM10012284_28260 [Mangrovihabitans endophyticus]
MALPQRTSPSPRVYRAERHPRRTARCLGNMLTAVIVITICAASVLLMQDDGADARAGQSTGPGAATHHHGNRAADGPLDPRAVFPGTQISVGAATYRIELTQVDTECRMAVTGGLGDILAEDRCSQVVRARMIPPYGDRFRVTAGVFTLPDADGAARVRDRIRSLVEGGEGNFAPLGTGLSPAPELPSQVGWQVTDRYLLYCVVSPRDGRPIAASDPTGQRIAEDLLERYLSGGVLSA